MSEHDYQTLLEREGVAVVPTPLVDDALCAQAQQGFLTHLSESPEFNSPDPNDPSWKPQLGGFAAMANPSSFHHPWVRKMREVMEAHLLDLDVLPVKGRKLEQCFDRLMYRIAGERPTAESMHRDEAKEALDGDDIFGGWVNLESEPQYFSCAPRTHTEVGGQNRGFAKIASKEEQAKYRPLFRRVAIPPGHCMIFYERLVHEVLATPADRTMVRMFLGWRATRASEPLFGANATRDWLVDQAVPKIKSGQDPPVWPSAYSNFPRNFQTLTDWSRRTYVPACLYTQTVGGSGAFAGTRWERVKAKMLSLRAYGLPLHAAYDQHEAALLAPQRRWMLYAFDSPGERVAFESVSEDEWRAYETALRVVPLGGSVRRPRPERV